MALVAIENNKEKKTFLIRINRDSSVNKRKIVQTKPNFEAPEILSDFITQMLRRE